MLVLKDCTKKNTIRKKGRPKLKEFREKELKKTLQDHKKWLDSYRKEGQKTI